MYEIFFFLKKLFWEKVLLLLFFKISSVRDSSSSIEVLVKLVSSKDELKRDEFHMFKRTHLQYPQILLKYTLNNKLILK